MIIYITDLKVIKIKFNSFTAYCKRKLKRVYYVIQNYFQLNFLISLWICEPFQKCLKPRRVLWLRIACPLLSAFLWEKLQLSNLGTSPTSLEELQRWHLGILLKWRHANLDFFWLPSHFVMLLCLMSYCHNNSPPPLIV